MARRLITLFIAVALVVPAACGSPSTEAGDGSGNGAPSSGDGVDSASPSSDPDQPVSSQNPDECDGEPDSRDTDKSDEGEDFAPCNDPGSNLQGRPYRLVKPRSGMTDVHSISWEEAKVVGDGDTVLITFYSGVAPCNVLDHTTVVIGEDEIQITLFEGSDPDKPDAVCIEIAMLKAVKLDLGEPVGDRKISDGADD